MINRFAQFSITNTGMIDAGLNVSMQGNINATIDRDGGSMGTAGCGDIRIQPGRPFFRVL